MMHAYPAAAQSCRDCAEPFLPPAWLQGAHAQTIYASCLAPSPRIRFRRIRWSSPDGDFLDLDWLVPAKGTSRADSAASNAPLAVLFHGLEGSSNSHYARTLMHAVSARGWRGVVVHFRGCSGEPNRLPRAYHSGDSAEIEWVLQRLRGENEGPMAAVAVSLGANALLKWLGERAEAAREVVSAACAVSAPMDLAAAGEALGLGFNKLYTWNFLRTLKRKSVAKLTRFPHLFDRQAARRARSLRDFDDTVTAPLHGFVDAHDYWVRSSSKPWLKYIAVPTLILNARDDPFLPARALPQAHDVSDQVVLEFPAHGGHAGFVTGRFPGSLEWMPRRVLRFADDALRLERSHRASMA